MEMLEFLGKVLNRNAAKDEDKWNSTHSVMGLWNQTTSRSTNTSIVHCSNKKEHKT